MARGSWLTIPMIEDYESTGPVSRVTVIANSDEDAIEQAKGYLNTDVEPIQTDTHKGYYVVVFENADLI